MSIYYFADIDDNLVTSSDLQPKEGWVAIVRREDGIVTSYLTPKQRTLFETLKASGTVIPTTARSVAHFRNVELAFDNYAITSFGGVILMPDGNREPRWQAHIREQSARHNAELEALFAAVNKEVARQNFVDVQSIVSSDDGTPLFVYWQHKHRRIEELEALKDTLLSNLPEGWWFSFNGNFLAAMPPYLGKEKAVRWFLDNVAETGALAFGSGDSLTDLPFMGVCDFALVPVDSQIWRNMPKTQVADHPARGLKAAFGRWLQKVAIRLQQ